MSMSCSTTSPICAKRHSKKREKPDAPTCKEYQNTGSLYSRCRELRRGNIRHKKRRRGPISVRLTNSSAYHIVFHLIKIQTLAGRFYPNHTIESGFTHLGFVAFSANVRLSNTKTIVLFCSVIKK